MLQFNQIYQSLKTYNQALVTNVHVDIIPATNKGYTYNCRVFAQNHAITLLCDTSLKRQSFVSGVSIQSHASNDSQDIFYFGTTTGQSVWNLQLHNQYMAYACACQGALTVSFNCRNLQTNSAVEPVASPVQFKQLNTLFNSNGLHEMTEQTSQENRLMDGQSKALFRRKLPSVTNRC